MSAWNKINSRLEGGAIIEWGGGGGALEVILNVQDSRSLRRAVIYLV